MPLHFERILTLSYLTEINTSLGPQWYSAPLKNMPLVCSQRAMLPSRMWQSAADSKGSLAHFVKKI